MLALLYLPFMLFRVVFIAFRLFRVIGILLWVLASFALRQSNRKAAKNATRGTRSRKTRTAPYPRPGGQKVFL